MHRSSAAYGFFCTGNPVRGLRPCRRNAPPLFFVLPKKSRRARWKRNRFLPQILALAGIGLLIYESGWLEVLPVSCESPAGCDVPISMQKFFPAFGGFGIGLGWLRAICPSCPAAATRCKEAGPIHIPGGGIQRRGPQPPPLSRFKGVRGEIEIPPGFLFGVWGIFLFQKEMSPTVSLHRTRCNLFTDSSAARWPR